MIERALQRAESSAAARHIGPSHPAQNATSMSSSATELLARSTPMRVETVVQGDHPSAGLWLLVAVVGIIVVLVYFMLRS